MAAILPAERTKTITYAIRDIVVKAQALEREGRKVIYLNIGDPPVYDFDTPQHIKERLKRKIDDVSGRKSAAYADSMGLHEAREAIAKRLRTRGLAAETDDIVLTAGATEGIMLAVAALVNPGENLLLPLPGYPLYRSTLALYHGAAKHYRLDEAHDWQIDFDSLEEAVDAKTRGLVVISPNNPTGGVYTEETLKRLVAFAERHGLVLFADEIYDQLLLDDGYAHHPLARLAGDVPVLSFGGLSKNYVMPGYRVGWIHFHDPAGRMTKLVAAVKQLMRARLSGPHLQQHAIIAALEGDHSFLDGMRARLREQRDLTIRMLGAIPGIRCTPPHGAFYAFPGVQLPQGVTDKEYVEALLAAEGVVVVYGSGFGMTEAEDADGVRWGHFRVVFLAGPDILEEAYAKIARFTKAFYRRHGYVPR